VEWWGRTSSNSTSVVYQLTKHLKETNTPPTSTPKQREKQGRNNNSDDGGSNEEDDDNDQQKKEKKIYMEIQYYEALGEERTSQ
jgi:hypothetical protein